MPTVIVLGGGIAGLTVAHELVERGFAVTVFEKSAVWGGKARSYGDPGTGTDGRHDLPAEHGFRFFPGFYKHVIDTMRRVPVGTATAFDHLVPTTEVLIAQADGRPMIRVPSRFPQNLSEWRAEFQDWRNRTDLGIPHDETRHFVGQLLMLFTACRARQFAVYEYTDWWTHIGAASRSAQYQRLLGAGLTRSLVAMKAEQSNARTIGEMLQQIVKYVIEPGAATDRVLDGPTSEVWINPWTEYLAQRGVQLRTGHRVQSIDYADGAVRGVHLQDEFGVTTHVKGDYYVAALPVEVFRELATDAMTRAAPAIASLGKLNVEWMNGIVFYLRQDVQIGRGHVILVDSPWSLTCVSQPQFWFTSASEFGSGDTGGFISVDISNWVAPGQYVTLKWAADCTREEIAAECWQQMKAHLPMLSDDDLLGPIEAPPGRRPWFLDNDIETSEDNPSRSQGVDAALRGPQTVAALSASAPPLDRDSEPLLVNLKGSYAYRPDADVGLTNLYLASDYVRTDTDLASMEGANEAGRRAANAILKASGSTAPPCQLWPLTGLWALAPFRAIDWCLFHLGLPQVPIGTYHALLKPVILFAAIVTGALVGMAHWGRRVRAVFPADRAAMVTLMLLLTGADAVADGWKIQLQGVRALGSAYAGRSVLADDASTVWFNPAGMTLLADRWVVTAGAPLITYSLRFADAGSTSLIGQPMAGTNPQDGGMTTPVPHLYVARRLSDRWRVGLGFNAPFGLGSDYGAAWVGRYHASTTQLRVFNLNPSMAVRLNGRWSIGAGINLQRSVATLGNAIDFGSFGAALGLPLTPQAQDGTVEFTGTDWAFGVNVGVLGELGTGTRVGAAYRSNTTHVLRGRADFTVPAAAAALTAGGVLFADADAVTELPMPQELSVSASHPVSGRVTLLGDVTWSDWSRFEELRLDFENPSQPAVVQPNGWHDSIRGALGLRVTASPRVALRVGAAYERAPVPDATRGPRLPEADHIWLAAGADFRVTERFGLDLQYANLQTPSAGIGLADPAAGRLQGAVAWRLNIFSIGAQWRF